MSVVRLIPNRIAAPSVPPTRPLHAVSDCMIFSRCFLSYSSAPALISGPELNALRAAPLGRVSESERHSTGRTDHCETRGPQPFFPGCGSLRRPDAHSLCAYACFPGVPIRAPAERVAISAEFQLGCPLLRPGRACPGRLDPIARFFAYWL